MNPLRRLAQQGQSVWFDGLQRSVIWTGRLHRMIQEDGLMGAGSHPRVLEEAIEGSNDYFWGLAALVTEGFDPSEAYEHIAVEDIQWACDVLRPVYDRTDGRDGFCRMAVSPHVADDPIEVVEEANRLWDLIARDNLMVRVPATQAGLTVIPDLIAQGLNVDATHIFSVGRYEAAHEAYIKGLEELVRTGGDPSLVASVASVFVSRIDAWIDAQIDERLAHPDVEDAGRLQPLRGQAAIATAKLAYRAFERMMASDRWAALQAEGARPQRLLWASTSVKDPAFRDIRYVEALVAPQTVVALSDATYEAFADHGELGPGLRDGMDEAEATLAALEAVGISTADAAANLEEEGIQAMVEAYDRLMGVMQGARTIIMGEHQPTVDYRLGGYEAAVEDRLTALDEIAFVRRLWGRDGSLFGDGEVADAAERAMGWLDLVDAHRGEAEPFVGFQDQLESDQTESVVVVGMGGSGLAAEVFAQTFGQLDGSPELLILDSTVPGQIRAIEGDVTPEETVFIVASKSGTTLEVRALEAYFHEQLKTGDNFVAITDPGSDLEDLAYDREFLAVFLGDAEVGGCFSALSAFGLLPAAAMGLDVEELLERAKLMVASCSESVPGGDNPGVRLGATIGELARAGRDKMTFVLSPGLTGFGGWLEQLIAESTGKAGTGVVPVVAETLATPDKYGDDRVFVYIALDDDDDDAHAVVLDHLDALHAAGHPVMAISLTDPRDLAQEMFRWQVAAATAGQVLGVSPFDRPDVETTKRHTLALLAQYGATQATPEAPGLITVAEGEGLTVYADAANARALGTGSVQEVLRAHLARLGPGDYLAFNAYIEMSEANDAALQRIRGTVRDHYRVATTVGFGPRYLHVTGQLQKGGPDTGLFVQITNDDPEDLAVPGRPYTFGVLKAAQQAGDFMALAEWRQIRVHVGVDVAAGLETLYRLLTTH